MTRSNSNLNDSDISGKSLVMGEEDLQDLINELDIEAIRREVFSLYDIRFGLDTQLALRKV